MLKKLFYNERFAAILWAGLALATILQNVVIRGKYNNYLIFEGVFNQEACISHRRCRFYREFLY